MLLPTFILTILSILGLASAATASSKLAASRRAITIQSNSPKSYLQYCPTGFSTCSVDSETGISTALTCKNNYYLKAGKCPPCPAGKSSTYDNKDSFCSVCSNKYASTCIIGGEDLTCHSGYFLTSNPSDTFVICSACSGGYSTKENLGWLTCDECPANALKCNMNVSPVVPTVCLNTYVLKKSGGTTQCVRQHY